MEESFNNQISQLKHQKIVSDLPKVNIILIFSC